MGYADRDLDPRMGHSYHHAEPSSPFPQRTHSRYAYEHSRDAAMNRDRSSDRRDRGRSDREPRGAENSHSRLRSPASASRRTEDIRELNYSRDAHERRDNQYPESNPHRGRSADHRRPEERHDTAPHDVRRGTDYDRSYDRVPPGSREDIPNAPRGPRRRSRSPVSPGKRRRSLSPVPNRNKRSKRDRGERRRAKKEKARNARQPSPFPRRSPSPYRNRHPYPSGLRSDRPDLFEQHPSRLRSRSPLPPREPSLDRGPSPPPNRSHAHPRRDSYLTNRSRTPSRPGSRHSALSRAHSPHPPSHPPPGTSEAGSYSRRSSPAAEPPRSNRPHSPWGDRGPPTGPSSSRKKGKRRDEARPAKRGQFSSGANSIEVNMNRRSDLRGTHGTHISSSRPSRNLNDAHYNQSPTHVASGSSYYGSPIAQSPHGGGGRAGRNGQQQYSPQGGTPTGPQAHFNQSPSHTPTGPMNSGRGFSRGGFRGGSFSSARGGSRGGGSFKPPTGPAAERGHLSRSGENTPNHSSPRYPASNHSDAMALTIDDPGDEQSSRLSKDVQAEDPVPDKDNDEQMPPPTRAPPTGPAAGTPSGPKFSFAFKATSKAPVAAPKPEISQKFSAAPPRREPQPVDDRSNRDRDLPRGTPTEPASSRARSDYNRQRQSEPPRTRVVKRIEQQLKPKPILPEHLATSDSPFYRKPGNESVVGSGTYGKVFKGMQIYSGRLVALKKIRMEGERDGFPVTAVREIKLLQSLRHENIVALQEVMVEKNDCFMVFEYLSHDLTGLLNHPSFKLDPAQRKHLAKQLFEGLDYLHTRGVLHRDIKAANILVSSDGILKLADFGLARFYAKHHQNDYTNRVITIWYRSPELLLGETQYNAAVDVWSAACVMVEIFTRHAIFPGDGTEINQLDKIYAVLGTPNKVDWPDLIKMEWFELLRPSYRKPNVFAEKYRDRVPLAAFELLTSMFQYDPAKRPSASEVLADPYFTTEQPPPRQATELADIKGDWHEFESKALRREKEKQEREARRTASSKKETEKTEKDRKRPGSSHDVRDSKRLHIEGQPLSTGKPSGAAVA